MVLVTRFGRAHAEFPTVEITLILQVVLTKIWSFLSTLDQVL